jgi:hypothetical protein
VLGMRGKMGSKCLIISNTEWGTFIFCLIQWWCLRWFLGYCSWPKRGLRWARDQVPFAELKGEQSNAFQAGFSACTSWRVKKTRLSLWGLDYRGCRKGTGSIKCRIN